MQPKNSAAPQSNPSAPADGAPTSTSSTSTDVTPKARLHRATYSKDKRKGGYLVRVEGPAAGKFLDRIVPVTTRDNTEHMERLTALLWTGTDEESGKPVALYTFEQKPREPDQVEF